MCRVMTSKQPYRISLILSHGYRRGTHVIWKTQCVLCDFITTSRSWLP